MKEETVIELERDNKVIKLRRYKPELVDGTQSKRWRYEFIYFNTNSSENTSSFFLGRSFNTAMKHFNEAAKALGNVDIIVPS